MEEREAEKENTDEHRWEENTDGHR